MRARKFYFDDPVSGDTGSNSDTSSDTTPTTDDPGRTDTDTTSKKKAE